jgi:hypothetical protein
VARHDAFIRAFEHRCRDENSGLGALNACGVALRGEFGFPDKSCAIDGPLSEFDLLVTPAPPEPPGVAGGEAAAKVTAEPAVPAPSGVVEPPPALLD